MLLHTLAVDIRVAFQTLRRVSFGEELEDLLPSPSTLASDPIASATSLQPAYMSYRQSREMDGRGPQAHCNSVSKLPARASSRRLCASLTSLAAPPTHASPRSLARYTYDASSHRHHLSRGTADSSSLNRRPPIVRPLVCLHCSALLTLPFASPGDKDLLIKVDAIALNLVDSRYSYYPIKTSESRVIGSDLSGTVVELGEL